MNEQDELGGIFDAVQSDQDHSFQPEVKTEETEQESAREESAVAEGQEAEETQTEQPKTDEVEETTETSETTETEEHSKTETEEAPDWKNTLPPAPKPYDGPTPEIDPETGEVTNMTPQQYEDYLIGKAQAKMRAEMYENYVENTALEQAEQILPELKTNPVVRQMVENIRVASVINGQQIDSVEAAKQVKELLGGARTEGANNAKTSIEVQKQASLDTGKSQVSEPSNEDKLFKRLQKGDNDAFVEIMDMWESEGKV